MEHGSHALDFTSVFFGQPSSTRTELDALSANLRRSILLDAARIIPDSREDSLSAVANGRGMCKIHHAAFDAKILGIRPDVIVEIRSDILAEIDGPMLKHGLQEHHRQKLRSVPMKKADRPSPSLLEEAYSRFKEA